MSAYLELGTEESLHLRLGKARIDAPSLGAANNSDSMIKAIFTSKLEF